MCSQDNLKSCEQTCVTFSAKSQLAYDK